ncbi:hypothetical protein Calag_1055 [Caldisphaera lagunensis DSM 15908]|uniref:Uncharacterized protein n=1 Tax=Caldisphaera lagunensis (strain DSM 15908 / JCM 11604 / ANMR 0165 / IC-154) TaxID=1056495 RepID=L0ACB6_CALLD|nr:hypothetical protein [Caldisphaera lagunensis]AFZ70777.1 hypothetical protein Calag_1055 [Caldisphaera lagunensis DSM 15908]
MLKKYLLMIATFMLVASIIAFPLASMADYFQNNYTSNNYIIVYPNSISLLFNGSKYVDSEGYGSLNVNLLFLSGSKELTLNLSKYVDNNKYSLSEFKLYYNANGGMGISNYTSIHESQYFNSTSNGHLIVTANPSTKIYYINLSLYAVWEGSINYSNDIFNQLNNYQQFISQQFNMNDNFENNFNIQGVSNIFGFSSFNYSNIPGLNITYYNVKINKNSIYIEINATFNSSVITQNNANNESVLINNLINSYLKPKYLYISSYKIVENHTLKANLYINTNINLTSTSIPSYSNLNLNNIPQISQFNISIIKNALNASVEIIKYINNNYEILTPSSLSLNISYGNKIINYSLETPKIAFKTSTNAKENLLGIDYLIGNMSNILEQNGFDQLASKVNSAYMVKVTLIGKGVTVKPNQTTIGNLSNVSVVVNSNNSNMMTKEAIGGSVAVVLVILIAVILIKRHF